MSRALSPLLVAPLLVVLLSSPARVSAQQQPDGKALAEALFQDGRTLLDEGKAPEACAKFAMSQRIEPKLGTLLNLASCHEQIGKTATAWAEFTESITQAARAHHAGREQFAREHADRLFPLLSRIRLTLQTTAEQQPDQQQPPPSSSPLIVSIDDVTIDRAVLDTAFPVDPGDHVLVVRAPRKKAWTQKIVVADGAGLLPVTIPPLEAEEQQPGNDAERTPPPADANRPKTRPIAPWIAFGIGAVGVGVGTYFGLRAFTKQDDARPECGGPTGSSCSQRGLDLHDEATTSAHVSTIAFGVGLVAVGVGVYFLLRQPASGAGTTNNNKVQASVRMLGAGAFAW